MKNQHIQSLRGLACVLLVLYHVVGATGEQGLKLPDGWMRVLADQMAVIRMPLFALLAGALYGRGSGTRPGLVFDKFHRLIVPMLTVGSIFAVVQSLVPGSNQQVNEWHLLHIVPVAHFWFLESLFLLFCAMVCVESLLPLRSLKSWLLVMLISVLLYCLRAGVVWFGVLGAVYLMPYFLLGLALTRLSWDKSVHKDAWGSALLIFAAIVLVTHNAFEPVLDRFEPVALVVGLMFSAGLWLRPLKSRVLAWIGDYSFSIFLFHVFFTAAARITLHRLGVDAIPVHVGAGMLFGLLGPVPIHHFITSSSLLRRLVLGMPAHGVGKHIVPKGGAVV